MDNFLAISKIYKSFMQGSSPVAVLKNVSYCFDFSQTYAITGASGTGKSTLINLLAGTDSPDQGTINWCDKFKINSLSDLQKEQYWNQKVGLIFQQPGLIDELTVLENVLLKGLIGNFSMAKERAVELLKRVGLGSRMQFFPSVLSRGERQRVAIARALMCDPKLILADEPTGSLDRQCGLEIINMLIQISKKQHIGLILSTHDKYVYKSMDVVLEISNQKLNLV